MPSLREDFEASIADLSKEPADDGQQAQEPVVEAAPAADKPADKPAAESTDKPAAARDASGRFAPKTPSQDTLPADQQPKPEGQQQVAPTAEQTPAEQPQQQAQALRAPHSWKPEEREGWDKIDPRHQAAIMRREREVSQALEQSSGARRIVDEMSGVLQPFMPFIQAEGSTPIQAIQNTMQSAMLLRVGSPHQKAQFVANVIKQYGIPLDTLDSMLAGQQVQPGPQDQIYQQVQAALQPVQQFIQQQRTAQQTTSQQTEAQATQALQEFLQDPQNEFAWDLRHDIADILDMSAKRGQQMTLSDAYKRATLLHPTISKIVEQRQTTQGAAQQTAAARRAKQAAASLPSGGAPTGGSDEPADDGTLRSALNASIRQHSRQAQR